MEKMNVTLNRSIAKECRSFFNSFIRNDQQPVSQMSIDCERQQHTRFQNSSSDFNVYPSSIDTAPFVTPPPSTTTRLAFQTLTNLVSWTSRNRSSSTQASVPATPTRSTSSTQGSPPLTERGVVSREKQLHRLRIQMEGVGIQPCVGIQCKKCRGEVVVVWDKLIPIKPFSRPLYAVLVPLRPPLLTMLYATTPFFHPYAFFSFRSFNFIDGWIIHCNLAFSVLALDLSLMP